MKKINILYWVFTGLFAALMIFSSFSNIVTAPDAVELIKAKLGYPTYIIPFLGVAKLLGSIAILIPRFPRLKEWAYAGLMYDLIGATYSSFAIGEAGAAFMVIFIAMGFASYYFYRRRETMMTAAK
ncbi:MAG TPA: DoxX family protein [Chryseolinea sp.]